MGRLTTTSHRLFHRHQTVPLLTLEVGPAALAELTAASLYVEKITEDGLSAPAARRVCHSTQTPPGAAGRLRRNGLDGGPSWIREWTRRISSSGAKVVEAACYSSTVKNASTTLCPNGQEQQNRSGIRRQLPDRRVLAGTHVAESSRATAGRWRSRASLRGRDHGASRFSPASTTRRTAHSAAPCVLAWDSDPDRGTGAGLRPPRYASLRRGQSEPERRGAVLRASCDGEPIKKIIDNTPLGGHAPPSSPRK